MKRPTKNPDKPYYVAEYRGGDYAEWLLKELYVAYRMARRGKRKTVDEHTFEVNELENLVRLRDDILSRNYKPSRGVAFLISRPVIREIFAAPFRDRIVHHFLYNVSAKWLDDRLINDSYSCRNNKGALYGIKRLEHFIRKVSKNGKEDVFVAKLDLQGYFMSLRRKSLNDVIQKGLKRQFKRNEGHLYRTVRFLWKEIIFDDPIEGVKIRGNIKNWRKLPRSKSLFAQKKGLGIVIGNLTSQLLSNIYLNALDRFITMTLGYKFYGRYVDDFFIVVPMDQKEQLLRDVKVIEKFLKEELGLTLHPKKRVFRTARQGIPFLGAVVYLDHTVPGRRVSHNCRLAFGRYAEGIKDSAESVTSYRGHLKYINSKHFLKKLDEA